MSSPLTLVLAGMGGVGLGALFFGGLFWTVRRVVVSQMAAQWILGSLLLRAGATLAGFLLLSGGHLDRIFAGLVGFVAARVLVTRLTRSLGDDEPRVAEPRHAP